MGSGSAGVSTTLVYEATGIVRAGGEGRLDAHGLVAPFDATAGRLETLPGPADLLGAALCACILKNVERFSHMLPFAYESAKVKVVADREEPPPHIARMRYELEIVTEEPPARVELLHRNIQRFGTITNTLGKACDLSGTIRAVAKSGALPGESTGTP